MGGLKKVRSSSMSPEVGVDGEDEVLEQEDDPWQELGLFRPHTGAGSPDRNGTCDGSTRQEWDLWRLRTGAGRFLLVGIVACGADCWQEL